MSEFWVGGGRRNEGESTGVGVAKGQAQVKGLSSMKPGREIYSISTWRMTGGKCGRFALLAQIR